MLTIYTPDNSWISRISTIGNENWTHSDNIWYRIRRHTVVNITFHYTAHKKQDPNNTDPKSAPFDCDQLQVSF